MEREFKAQFLGLSSQDGETGGASLTDGVQLIEVRLSQVPVKRRKKPSHRLAGCNDPAIGVRQARRRY